ncbi:uncharacterized protein MELLADRAFT_113048 [Melampsora larici-populina 98AG31]|uniref:Uncharacterized protein n=1 Tax=Melampsora larici-populina (strain 98AG31 / pathotype 3-4-7) TaxID=747676 RepID=F4S8L7_MELLP|nr:uncharacterized protein MELLADRAFT_113048 [Melampsora larici-populina 98AG31]EGF99011.1 hypothetical protein MELLADRAFT_113048 [Melampsora larici-populina 98AG31]
MSRQTEDIQTEEAVTDLTNTPAVEADSGGISLEELAQNLLVAEEAHISTNYPPFIERFTLDTLDPRLFARISSAVPEMANRLSVNQCIRGGHVDTRKNNAAG